VVGVSELGQDTGKWSFRIAREEEEEEEQQQERNNNKKANKQSK
jgi:hypothetical protein